jgi:hypothetical protein
MLERTDSIEEAAVIMMGTWPRLAKYWPVDAPGREVVELFLMHGAKMGARQFGGMDFPPYLPAVRWLCLCIEKDKIDMGLRSGAQEWSDHRGYTCIRDIGRFGELREMMSDSIGSGFVTLEEIPLMFFPTIDPKWRVSWECNWNIVSDIVTSKFGLQGKGGLHIERHTVSLRSRSHDHYDGLFEMMKPYSA